jgi:hypothetical protein
MAGKPTKREPASLGELQQLCTQNGGSASSELAKLIGSDVAKGVGAAKLAKRDLASVGTL